MFTLMGFSSIQKIGALVVGLIVIVVLLLMHRSAKGLFTPHRVFGMIPMPIIKARY